MRPGEGSTLGHINRDVKNAGARSAGNSHAACDVAGVGDGITELPKRARRKVETPDTAKELPTDLRASARPYQVGATGIPAISVNFQIKRTSSVSRTSICGTFDSMDQRYFGRRPIWKRNSEPSSSISIDIARTPAWK